MKRFIPTLLLILPSILIINACGTDEKAINDSIPQGRIPIKVSPIELSENNMDIQGTGQFTTDDETLLSFKTGGIISQILVSEGDKIQKGQLLATLDLTEINTGVAQAELGYEKALRDYQRVQRLLADSVATLEQSENSKTALDIASQNLQAAKFNKDYSQIRAVSNGYVLKKFANPGQQISSGAPVLQTNGMGKGNWKLKVALSDRDWATVQEGDKVEIITPVQPDSPYQASVKRKAKVADVMTGTYQVEIEFSEVAPDYLASGMFGTAIIHSSNSLPTWYVPYEAILDANGGKGYVFVTKDNQSAEKISVILGRIYPDKVQVISGLEGHENLIIAGSAYLSDQSLISIQN
jgi:RND family efflux transporter MFP subunit